MQRQTLIALDHVHMVYEDHHGNAKPVLSDIHLDIAEGEFVAVIGENGSGKSTLSKLMNGLLVPTLGSVRIAGMDTRDGQRLHQIHGLVGMVFQDPDNQMVSTVVEEDVAFGLENYGVPQADMRQRVERALRGVDMWEHRRRSPHQLSGGQKQRVAIAAVTAMQPRCIIFDEATSMLDPTGRDALLTALSQLHQDGMTIVLVTHHMDEAIMADRVVVLQRGQIVQDAPPQTVFADAERLRAWRVEPPIAVDVASRLVRHGWPIAGQPLTVDALVAQLVELPAKAPAPSVSAPVAPAFVRQLDTAPAHSSAPLIQIRNLQHRYMRGTPMEQLALAGISLAVWPGEFVAVVGRTGSGKSTLMQHLNGLLRPQVGSVEVDGIDIGSTKADLRRLRSIVGMAFQNPEDQLFEALVGDDVAYGLFQAGQPLIAIREQVRFALDAVGLDYDWRDIPIFGLSGGERRKVALAGILAMRPQVLVLDEPTAGLDPLSRAEFAARLTRLQRAAGMTVLWVTHQLEEAAQYASRVIVLNDGCIAADASPASLFSDTQLVERLHLRLPEAPALGRRLIQHGFPLTAVPLVRDEAVTAIHAALLEGRRAR